MSIAQCLGYLHPDKAVEAESILESLKSAKGLQEMYELEDRLEESLQFTHVENDTLVDDEWRKAVGDPISMCNWYTKRYPKIEPYFFYWLSRKQIGKPITAQELRNMKKQQKLDAKNRLKKETRKIRNHKRK